MPYLDFSPPSQTLAGALARYILRPSILFRPGYTPSMDSLDTLFLRFSRQKLGQLGGRIDDCLSRLTEQEIWFRANEQANSAGNLVLHLCGNVNQWLGTGVAAEGGVRDREAEFAARGGAGQTELREILARALERADRILASVSSNRLVERIEVQGYPVSVLEAIYHVVEHFAQHTGQIILITKQLKAQDLGYYRHLHRNHPHSDPAP